MRNIADLQLRKMMKNLELPRSYTILSYSNSLHREKIPICFQLLPYLDPTGKKYMTCCGKVICSGCCYAPIYDNQGNKVDNQKFAFCRTPHPTDEEITERFKKRVELEDTSAIHKLGVLYMMVHSDITHKIIRRH